MNVIAFTMDWWRKLKGFIFAQTPEDRLHLGINLKDIQTAAAQSLIGGTFDFFLLVDSKRLLGYAICAYVPNYTNSKPQTHCYVHSICVSKEAPRTGALLLVGDIAKVAKARGATLMYGHVRPGGPIAAWERKFRLQHLYAVVGKRLDNG